ncbi:LOW QUALITY PROTEIN: hypothetical protein PHMEG_00024980 [Phytophthora megakarya]|uniref:HAT C-terminal dimerisation domain-containing protein n=1 Tax=Phytophthora megakarya TaxID=4795 RepID=A0A225VD40_9STRA|nr:LOW QUALITY PROTEIN: hypothetical protein PHMEG_00024980 [Phytophthora megakarya]
MSAVFWGSLTTGTALETGEYLAEHRGLVIDEVVHETGAVVAGMLADNASNMDTAWKVLERTRPIFGGGCAAHILNLLIQDICKINSSRPLKPGRLLLRLTFEITTSYSVIKEKLGKVKTASKDASFWRKLEQIVAFSDPVIEAIRELESDACPTSHVYSRFQWLLKHPAYGTNADQTDIQAAIKAAVEDRWQHTLIALLGLTKRIRLIKAATSPKEVEFFNHALYRFANEKQDGVLNSEDMKVLNLATGEKDEIPLAQELAKLVFAIPTSSAASERTWSIMDFIHSKKRNKLTIDKLDMLAYIYVNHHSVSKKDRPHKPTDWAQLESYPEEHEAVERTSSEQ